MNRNFFHLICIFNIFILNCVADDVVTQHPKNKHPYDLIYYSYRFLSSSLSLKDKSPIVLNDIHFSELNKNLTVESVEELSLNSSKKCLNDILYTFQSVSNSSNLWAWYFLDSFAKPPDSGFLIGNTKWLGEYNECKDVHAPAKASDSSVGNFNGQYCTLTYDLTLNNMSIPLLFGICLPDSCSPQDLQRDILQLLFQTGKFPVVLETSEESLTKSPVSITCEQQKSQLTAAAISVIVLLSVFCFISVLGSSITAVKFFKKVLQEYRRSSLVINIPNYDIIYDPDYVSEKNSEADDVSLLQSHKSDGFLDNCVSCLTCFCVFTNGAKLLNTDSSEGQLLCIHGIRFLSMSWVILGHSYMFGALQIRNLAEVGSVIDDFAFQAVLQGFYSVDSFFVLSGFLLSYLTMKELSKTKGSINWAYFYVHRYIRLTPVYMIVLGFSASVYFYLGSGPFWPAADHDANCQKTWWWNLLYINNFVDSSDMCMGWSWYLANDMQFYIVSPIILISLWRWPKIGFSVIGLFFGACIFSNFFITYHYDLMVGLVGIDPAAAKNPNFMITFMNFFNKLYIKPYTRIGPYLSGIITGYILYKHKTNNRPKLNWVQLSVGWIVASSVTLTCVYGLYHAHPSLIARSIYNSVNRTLFGCGLSWVIYVCLTNQSKIIDSILSFKLFIPLSRLTYAAYLIHPLIITGYYYSLKVPLEFSHTTMVLLFLGIMIVTYALALPVSLILESPIVSLEKLIRKKISNKTKEPYE